MMKLLDVVAWFLSTLGLIGLFLPNSWNASMWMLETQLRLYYLRNLAPIFFLMAISGNALLARKLSR